MPQILKKIPVKQIRNSRIIHKFSSNKNAGDEQAMNIEGIDGEGGLSLNEAIEINVGNDEATGAAIGVLQDSV